MIELTDKQQAVVKLLARAAKRRESTPTFREIAQALGVDVRAAYQHIEALERKGVVRRLGGRRGIELTDEFLPPVGLPVIGRVAAGLPILAEQNVDEYIDLGSEVATAADEDGFLLKVKGDSMVDRNIFDGDFVLVRPVPRLDPGAVGVVAVDGEATVKEVHVRPDHIVLVSHNKTKNYPNMVYDRRQNVRIVGKVIMAFRFIR